MSPCGKEGQGSLVLDEGQYCQWFERGDLSTLLSTGEILPGVMCPALGSPERRT